jgi:uroporphyrinogen-III synthase
LTTLAFTRPLRRLDESIVIAREYGFDVIATPSLDIVHGDPKDYADIGKKLKERVFRTVIFSSATAAEECRNEWGDDLSSLFKDTEVISIGPGTSKALEKMSVRTSSMPSEYTSSGLVEHLNRNRDGREVLIIHSDRGSPVLKDGLESSGFSVEELIAYTLEKHEGGLDEMRSAILADRVDVIAFTSRMSVESFLDSIGLDKEVIFKKAKAAAIGPPTKERLEEAGIHVDIIPQNATFRDLLQTIKDSFGMVSE